MPQYEVKVRVDYFYEVEAENEAEAIEQGWHYEDYAHFADVYSVDVTEVAEEVEDEDE